MKSERKKAIKAPMTRNGPKAILLFKVLSVNTNNTIPNTAPIMKDIAKAVTDNRGFKNKPIKKASLASPKPIARPLEKKYIEKKNKKAAIAVKIGQRKISILGDLRKL